MAKGYNHLGDYNDLFSPLVKLVIVRLLLVIAITWPVHHLMLTMPFFT